MNFSYKRYWEPTTAQVLGYSMAVNALASYITYPMEFVKTRIQVKAEGIGIRQDNHLAGYNPFKVMREIHDSGRGFAGLYEGFSSYILSRLSYLFIRNIVYKETYDVFKPFKPSNDLTTREKAVIAGFAGGLAAFITNPIELVNTRIICDGGIYKPHRRNYKGLADGFSSILQEGGKSALWRGGFANVLRAVALNASLTGPFDYLCEKCNIIFGDIQFNRFAALIWASMWGTLAVLPFDTVKTRLMKQFPNSNFNRVQYKGWFDCVGKIIQNEGLFGFFPGYYALYMKIFCYSFFTVYTMDFITSGLKRKAGLQSWQI